MHASPEAVGFGLSPSLIRRRWQAALFVAACIAIFTGPGAAAQSHVATSVAPTAAPNAVPVTDVRIVGLGSAETDNVATVLGLSRLSATQRRKLTEARLQFLLRRIPSEVRTALEPFGFYAPIVSIEREAVSQGVRIAVKVDAGRPVMVTSLDAKIEGAASTDRFVMRELPKLRPKQGARFIHAEYEAGKLRVDRKLAERGYFKAKRTSNRVEVSRGAATADIALAWESGPRHAMGRAEFAPNQFREGLLDPLVDWSPGDTYHRNRLIRLQRNLAALDYFALIDVTPDEDAAPNDSLRVPVRITTTPAKRMTYSAAISLGTDSGLGVRGGMNRRWVNSRGHKWVSDAEWSQVRVAASTQYRIPAIRRLPGWYSTELAYADENTPGVIGFVRSTSRTGWQGQREPWSASADLILARERTRSQLRIVQGTQRLAYAETSLQYRPSDDPLWPEQSLQLRALLRAGRVDTDFESRRFTQITLGAQWVHAFNDHQRVLLRSDLGTTALSGSPEFADFPTSLRFFAGGDQSIRGYGYREVGPRTEGEVLGGFHLVTASAEFQHFFNDTWGAAVFADAGDTFNTRQDFDPKLGVGVGARWRSPVGLVGVDVAHGLDEEAGGGTRLHISFGVQF